MRVTSRRAADVRVGPESPTHRALLRRGMRCAQWLAKHQRERINVFVTGTVQHLKPSNEAVN